MPSLLHKLLNCFVPKALVKRSALCSEEGVIGTSQFDSSPKSNVRFSSGCHSEADRQNRQTDSLRAENKHGAEGNLSHQKQDGRSEQETSGRRREVVGSKHIRDDAGKQSGGSGQWESRPQSRRCFRSGTHAQREETRGRGEAASSEIDRYGGWRWRH